VGWKYLEGEMSDEDEEIEVQMPVAPPEDAVYSDTSTYAQTLSNTVLALIQWDTLDPEAFAFQRMMIKKLVDTQVELKGLYIEENIPNRQEIPRVVEAPAEQQTRVKQEHSEDI
jgi:hypothetical protein